MHHESSLVLFSSSFAASSPLARKAQKPNQTHATCRLAPVTGEGYESSLSISSSSPLLPHRIHLQVMNLSHGIVRGIGVP